MPLLVKALLGFAGFFSAAMWGGAHHQPEILYLSAIVLGAGLGAMPNRWFWRS